MWSTVTPSVGSPVPCTRSKLAVCIHQNYIYLLGGRMRNQQTKDFWRYNIGEHTWSELKSIGDGPSRLEDHTMVAWKGNLYVFGGEVSFASTGETPLWIYNIAANTWRKKWKYYSIVQPQGCRGHTAVVFRGAMHIYGGYRDLKGSSSELWSFNFDKEIWQQAILRKNAEVPPGRHDHSAVIHDSAMWIYGGMTNLQERMDFWRWDFDTKRWARIKSKGGPGELHGHTACKVFSSMLLFGGERQRQAQDVLWRFHFATEAWERLNVNGVLPGPRSRHSSIVVPSVLLIPTEYKPSDRPKSIPCQSVLARTNGRQRPVSSPPTDTTEVEPDNCQLLEWQSEIGHLKATTDTHNQINFRTIKERISNVSLLKPSYSTYSALSNSSESVQDDEPDQIAEMQNCTNEKIRARNGTSLSIRYRNQISGETLSRDLMSVPNFQQLSNIVVPTREVQTPQATNSYGLYDAAEDNWISTSTEKLSFDKFLQYYSLVPGNETSNGIEHAITDSEDSGIHGDNGDKSNGSNSEECHSAILPGMVQSWDDNFSVPPRCRSSVIGDEFSLIDLHNDNNSHIGTRNEIQKNVTNNSVRFSTCSDIHKDFVSCLNHSTNTETIKRRRPPVAGLELKTFPQVQEEIIKSNQSADKRPKEGKQNGCDMKRVQLCNTTYLSEKNDNEEEQNDKDFPVKMEEQPHHFSMLIFGGREDGQQNSSINKALTIWRCEVWR